MDTLAQAIADVLKDYGLAGVVITALGYGWVKLANLYHEAQNARIQDGRDAVKALENNTNSMRELIDVVKGQKG